jgi:hypothetical protein
MKKDRDKWQQSEDTQAGLMVIVLVVILTLTVVSIILSLRILNLLTK